MFLKSLELFGFKSFADRTKVDFVPGITAIVGPNGCGKSNVVDAIKWVLGEKQARNIRGEVMGDVIFSGTEERKHLSLAEVFLTIDNSRRILDFDSDSVTVGRRIFRDGESEYLINKTPVRLKDIEKLFLDTGIGKSAYSVLEQGKMDLILSTRAEDRRYIFEEAAGISRYKLQKKESLKKLTETGENLNRINDIIREIERDKDFKARQAEKTKEYLGLRSRHNDLDIRINYLKFSDLKNRQEKTQGDIDELSSQREAISARISSISAENEKDEKERNDLQVQLFELEKRLHAYKIRVEEIDERTDKNRKLITEQESRKKSISKMIVEREQALQKLHDEKEKSERAGIDICGSIEEDRKRLREFSETRARKTDIIKQARVSIRENREKITAREKSLGALRDSLEVVIKRLIDAIDKRKAELQDSEKERQAVRERITGKLKGLETSLKSALKNIRDGRADLAAQDLDTVNVSEIATEIRKFESYEDGFRSILFDKGGIHAEKEDLDRSISDEVREIENLRAENSASEERIHNEQVELEHVNTMVTRVEKDLARNENERDWIEKHVASLDRQIEDIKRQIGNHGEELVRSDQIVENLKNEIREWEERLTEFNERSESLVRNISELTDRRSSIEKKIQQRKNISKKDEDELARIVQKIGNLDKSQVEIIFKKDALEDHLWTEYEKRITDLASMKISQSDAPSLQEQMQDVKKKIQELGPVNNLAIEEYRELKKRFDYYLDQKTDIEKAREDIVSVIEDINSTSIEMFLSTFGDIQKNFSEVFRQLFDGGEASLKLTDIENVLESGIDIMVRPPGKKAKNINLLSGGERALTAIALLFATYMAKPSPFCFLDEIDAPLDEENISRFVRMLRDFSKKTQFIIVTHNKKTMSISESLYGVTMNEPGISRVVSFKMESADDRKGQTA